MSLSFTIETANKSDKKDVMAFYKQQQYPAKFMGFDHCFVAKVDALIIGCVIISDIEKAHQKMLDNHDSNESKALFLHGLFVAPKYRNYGISKALIDEMALLKKSIICFADISLTALYLKSGFNKVSEDSLPKLYHERYKSYRNKQTNLLAFVRPILRR